MARRRPRTWWLTYTLDESDLVLFVITAEGADSRECRQQVMRALTIFERPVTGVAIGFLLRPIALLQDIAALTLTRDLRELPLAQR
jgi:hypothetical protein